MTEFWEDVVDAVRRQDEEAERTKEEREARREDAAREAALACERLAQVIESGMLYDGQFRCDWDYLQPYYSRAVKASGDFWRSRQTTADELDRDNEVTK